MPSEALPGEPADVPRNAVVIRFRPWQSGDVWNWACKEHRRIGRHRLSVFADTPRANETERDVIDRLLKASEIGIDPKKNKKFAICSSAAELLDLGFTFWKDGDDDKEPDEHYSVDLGADAAEEDVVKLLGVFRPAERR